MHDPLIILRKHWKHMQFRPLQREIIGSILKGQDTLAILPTGGGKSVCFQVPALLREGLCIVVTPLIALMKDQVESLRKKDILALAVHAGMTREEVDIALNNCIYGKVKFLYLSPERLHTEMFQARFPQMPVSLLVVDEAHCISQWGYDFRPSYLRIAELREVQPALQVVALTATATPHVKEDILAQLHFRQPYQTFQHTFARSNLSFVVRKSENKIRKLLEILKKVPGSAIVYVRSRQACEEIAETLGKTNISAAYYHAGLSHTKRSETQDRWIRNQVRVMAATNAFGMGIDKPDVRVVVHLDLPESLEAYYQEAGRAGRDGQRAYAVILFHESDEVDLRTKVERSHPDLPYLQRVYQALANHLQLAVGGGAGQSFDMDMPAFCERFGLFPGEASAALKKLGEEGLVEWSESFFNPSQVHLQLHRDKLYAFQVANAPFDALIKMLLRLYGGQLEGFVRISEHQLAQALRISQEEVVRMLRRLHELQVATYLPQKELPQVTFILPRQDAARLPLDRQRLAHRRGLAMERMEAMIRFATSGQTCRMQQVQLYFGEESWETCGICDVCVAKRKKENLAEAKGLRDEILRLAKENDYTLEQLEERIQPRDNELFVEVIRELVDENKLEYDEVWRLRRVRH